MFHDRLRATRISRGYTLQKTADSLDISLRTYQNYEGGRSEPSITQLIKLADFFMVSLDELVGRDWIGGSF